VGLKRAFSLRAEKGREEAAAELSPWSEFFRIIEVSSENRCNSQTSEVIAMSLEDSCAPRL
jgi:hypothetical protein